jgi:hypothetical protein
MEQLVPWAVFCTLALLLCTMKPGAGRIFMGLFFIVMALGVNVVLVLVAPDQFVALGTDSPIVPLYRWFFESVVPLAPPLFGLAAATYEIAVGLLMLGRGRQVVWGLIGGIAFLLVITPLGVWTLANPIMALALALLLRRNYNRSLADMLRHRQPVLGAS